jgi:hypothetical protein
MPDTKQRQHGYGQILSLTSSASLCGGASQRVGSQDLVPDVLKVIPKYPTVSSQAACPSRSDLRPRPRRGALQAPTCLIRLGPSTSFFGGEKESCDATQLPTHLSCGWVRMCSNHSHQSITSTSLYLSLPSAYKAPLCWNVLNFSRASAAPI